MNKMAKLKIELNGRPVQAEVGSTILEAARQNGVDVPTLCHDPRLKPYAACRICLVEVEGARGPVPACANQVSEGMSISTHTDNIATLRRVCLELLASDHYGDCVAPCKLACPAGIDIQGQLALIADGQYEEALKLIKESNPLPSVCGRVCPRFCEQNCRRNLVDEPVSINALKRFVADYDMAMANGPVMPAVKPSTGHKIAVIGGGPAGLSAAYFLALKGHGVTILDSAPALGGMLRYGIPEYRLPKADLDKEIATITALCDAVHLNSALGKDYTIESLKNSGFEVIFLALGSHASQKMRVEGEDLEGVLPGIHFLRDVVEGKKVELGKRVAVIGGGNTAMDATRTAMRLGAEEVMVLYRRSRDEMPAAAEEVEEAEHEGAQFHFLTAPVRIVEENGRAAGVECIKMELGEADSSGRRRPVPVEGSEFVIRVDTVIAAIGQSLAMPQLNTGTSPSLNSRGNIEVDKETMQTSTEGVFSGGDCASGPATVVQAVGAGKRAAYSINRYLNGEPVIPPVKPFNSSKGELNEIDPTEFADKPKIPRAKMQAISVGERKHNFREVETGLSEEDVRKEAMRCLSCGCTDVFDCELRSLSTEYAVEATKFSGEKHRLPIANDHQFIQRDNNKCILCGRCARICSELMGLGAISFVHRGFKTLVQPALGIPLAETQCESCGQCVSTCPTGALTVKTPLPKPGPWKTDDIPSACPQCSINCSLDLRVKGRRVVEVTSPIANKVNDGNLCKRGAYGTLFVNGPHRLIAPLVKRDGQLEPATWEEALEAAAAGLKAAKAQYSSDKLAVLASPKLTNEENYLAQKLARMAIGTNNIGNSFGLPENDALGQCFGKNSSTCSFDDLVNSDLVFVFGSDVCTDYPIVSLKIKEAVDKGSKLIIVNSEATRLDPIAEATLKVSKRMAEELLQTMLNYVFQYDLVDREFVERRTLGLQVLEHNMKPYSLETWDEAFWVKPSKVIELLHMYLRAKNPMIVIDADSIGMPELALVCNLALVTGNVARKGSGIIALRTYGNSQGQIDMGVSAEYLPGQEQVFDATPRERLKELWGKSLPKRKGISAQEMIQKAGSGTIRGLIAIGGGNDDLDIEHIGSSRAYSVLISPVFTEGMGQADVILPGSTFAETEGTFTSAELRIQRLHQGIAPEAGKQTWQVLCELSTALGYPMQYKGVPEIFREITKAVPDYSRLKFDKIPEGGVQLSTCDENTTFISPLWLEGMAEYGAKGK